MKEQKSLLTELGEAIDRYRAGRQAVQREQEPSLARSGRASRILCWLTPNGGALLLLAVAQTNLKHSSSAVQRS